MSANFSIGLSNNRERSDSGSSAIKQQLDTLIKNTNIYLKSEDIRALQDLASARNYLSEFSNDIDVESFYDLESIKEFLIEAVESKTGEGNEKERNLKPKMGEVSNEEKQLFEEQIIKLKDLKSVFEFARKYSVSQDDIISESLDKIKKYIKDENKKGYIGNDVLKFLERQPKEIAELEDLNSAFEYAESNALKINDDVESVENIKDFLLKQVEEKIKEQLENVQEDTTDLKTLFDLSNFINRYPFLEEEVVIKILEETKKDLLHKNEKGGIRVAERSKFSNPLEDEILNLSDFDAGFEFAEQNGYSDEMDDDIETLDELKQYLLNQISKVNSKGVDLNNWFGEVAKRDGEMQIDLEKIYDKMLNDFIRIAANEKKEPREMFEKQEPLCEERVTNYKEASKNGCPILIAGETGAGKSSFLNLLIGQDILPYDHRKSTTSTICEIHNKGEKEKKRVEIYGNGNNPKVEYLSDNVEEVREKLSKYANVTDRTSTAHTLLKIYWPVPFLQGNIYLVDSPGIGENDLMNEKVIDYLYKAVLFIYIVNPEIGGGVAYDRLGKLLKLVQCGAGRMDRLHQFDRKSALFIINKWDRVDQKARSKVQEWVTEQLADYWGNSADNDIEKQIKQLSVKEAQRCIEMNTGFTQQYLELQETLKKFMADGLELNKFRQYRWLSAILDRLNMPVASNIQAVRKRLEDDSYDVKRLQERLETFEKDSNNVMAELEDLFDQRSNEIVRELHNYLTTGQVRQELLDIWNSTENQPHEKYMKMNKQKALTLLQSTLDEYATKWESDHEKFAKARRELFERFQEKFKIIDAEFSNLEKQMGKETSGSQDPGRIEDGINMDQQENTQIGKAELFSSNEKVILGVTSPLWVPLAAVASVVVMPLVGTMAAFEYVSHKRKIKQYEKQAKTKLLEWSNSWLDNIDEASIQELYVEPNLSSLKDSLEWLKKKIPELIESDRALLNQISENYQDTTMVVNVYGKLQFKHNVVRNYLDLFALRYLQPKNPYRIEHEKIIWGKSIGRGSFGEVYEAKIMVKECATDVAVKIIMPLENTDDDTTAMYFCQEINNLITLTHDNIVKLINWSYERTFDRFIIVMERCKTTLEIEIFENQNMKPAQQHIIEKRIKEFSYVAEKAKQISEGLKFIHDTGYIHRDLKLSNILITYDGVVKLSDLGSSRPQFDFSNISGTLIYMDPFVLKGGLATNAADIYSFGLIMWELWYGELVTASTDIRAEFIDEVKGGFWKPEMRDPLPISLWKSLIDNCLNREPKERFKASDVNHQIRRLCAETFIAAAFKTPTLITCSPNMDAGNAKYNKPVESKKIQPSHDETKVSNSNSHPGNQRQIPNGNRTQQLDTLPRTTKSNSKNIFSESKPETMSYINKEQSPKDKYEYFPAFVPPR